MAKKNSNLGRKLAIGIGALFGIFVLAAIIVPLVVDVDKYKPLIVSKANERLNGKLELGDLDLSLWGRLQIDVDGLKLTDARGATVLAVKDANFNMPFWSVLTGSPKLRIEMNSPAINVVKHRNGTYNLMGLLKEQPEAGDKGAPAGAGGDKGKPKKEGAPKATEVPAIVMNSRITVLLDNANVAYKDESTGDAYNVKDLDFRLEDVSPSGNMPFEVRAELDVLAQQKIKVTGPVVLKGNVRAESNGGEFDKAELKASLELEKTSIVYPGVFNKKAGTALGADIAGTVGKDRFSIPTIKFRLADVTIDGRASGETKGQATTVDFSAKSNRIDVTKLGELSPLVTEYGLNGILQVGVEAQGPLHRLAYGADVKFNKITLNHESLKQPLEVNGEIAVGTSQLKNLVVKMVAKNFDISLRGSMQNFAQPTFKLNLTSSNMDLDGLLKASAQAAEERRTQAKAETSSSGDVTSSPKAENVVDYNAMFKPLRENPVTAAAAGTLDFNLKSVKSTGVTIKNVKGELALNKLLLALKNFSMDIFRGTIKGGMTFNARTPKPQVATNLTASGLDTKAMVENHMPLARNSIQGVIGANVNIGGAGLNHADIITGWKGSGSSQVKDAVFKTLDIGRVVRDGALAKLPPPLREKIKVSDKLLDHKGEYEHVAMKFGMESGVLNVTEFTGKAYPNKGLDLRGGGSVRLRDYALDMTVDIIDTYGLLNADKLAVDRRYGHFALSPKVKGTLFNPVFDWGATIGKLVQEAGKKQLEEQSKKQLEKFKDKLPGGLGNIFGGEKDSGGGGKKENPANAVKDAFKGLFGR